MKSWIQDVLQRYRWARMSNTNPTRAAIRCQVCGWEDSLWANGKNAATARAELRIRQHLILAHDGEGVDIPPTRWVS